MHKNKALVSLVFGLGLIIIGGLSLLGYGLYQRANNPDFSFFKSSGETPAKTYKATSKPAGDLPKNISIPLSKGSWISQVNSSDDKIIVHITNDAKRDLILILDANGGNIIRRIRFEPSP